MSTGTTSSSGSSVRDATINGRPVQSPLQVAEFLEGIVKKHLAAALTPEDKASMERANKKLMVHATTGLFIGSTLGATLAFRRRWMTGYRAAKAAQARASGAASQGSVPKLFYPAGAEKPTPRGETVGGSRFGLIAKGLGLGMLGALLGTQAGVWSGTRAAQRVIKESGHEERIAASLKQAMDKAMAEIQANSTGLEINHALLQKAQMQQRGAVQSAYGDDSSPESDPEPQGRDAFASEENLSEPHPSPEPSTANSTRWDELRATQSRAGPSSWDTIRESSSRNSLPPPTSRRQDLPASSESLSKDEQRRRFEEMMEKERRGGDEGFSNDKWK